MARPSNRGMERVDKENTGNCSNYFCTAIYIRLSYESDYAGSESIENQKVLLRDYLQRHKEFVLCEQFIDDGKTGTNFERPAFERMMKEVKDGSINCIVVKDVSRFGRNYVEVGDYIERIFPFLGVRFISINDGYDSFNPACDKDQLLLSIKNLMHEMYARDVSKKISSSIRIKQKTGEFYRTAIIPYGYKMGVSEYEIDEQAASVVRRIFNSFVSGDTVYQICAFLNKEGIASPKDYTTNKLLYSKENSDTCWLVSTVNRMLINEVYIGHMVRHKREQEFYSNKKARAVEEKDWLRAQYTHPAIIDKIIFMEVQRKLLQRKCQQKFQQSNKTTSKIVGVKHLKKYRYDENIFKNKIFCGECRTAMIRVNVETFVNTNTLIYKGFFCGLHRNCISKCSHKETIEEDVLCNMVNRIVVVQAKLYQGILSLIRRNGEDNLNKERALITADRKAIISTIKKYEETKLAILEEYHQGKIDKSQVMMRRREIQNLVIQWEERDKLLERQLLQVERLAKTYVDLMFAWLRDTEYPKITKEVVALFVERIDVYSKKRVVIKLKHIDYVKTIIGFVCEGGESNGSISNIFEVVERG